MRPCWIRLAGDCVIIEASSFCGSIIPHSILQSVKPQGSHIIKPAFYTYLLRASRTTGRHSPKLDPAKMIYGAKGLDASFRRSWAGRGWGLYGLSKFIGHRKRKGARRAASLAGQHEQRMRGCHQYRGLFSARSV